MHRMVLAISGASVIALAVLLVAWAARPSQAQPAPSVSLAPGWNAVVYGGPSLPVEQALSNCLPSVDAVFAWVPAPGAWRYWFKGTPAALNTLTVANSGASLWVRAVAACNWTQAGAAPPSAPGPAPSPCPQATPTPSPNETIDLGQGFTVEVLDSQYRVAPGGASGWFRTGQDADIMLSGIDFNNTGGPLLFNHPGGIASDGTRLVLADRNNNRLLIWNALPQRGDVPPDLVLGQADFTSNAPGNGLDGLNWPVGVATAGGRLAVTDVYNERVLVWLSFPTASKQPADFAIRLPGLLIWPWGVWTDGQRLIVTSTGGSSVLIWNSFPQSGEQQPDLVLDLPEFGTPRVVGSDGQSLVISDHNAQNNSGRQGTFFWRSFPTRDDQPFDFFFAAPPPSRDAIGQVLWGPTFTDDGRLVALGDRLYFWNGFPEGQYDPPDLAVGSAPGPQGGGCGFTFNGGDSSGIAYAGGQLFISMNNGNRVVVYRSLPTDSAALPDFALGSPDIHTNTLATHHFISNSVPATDGQSLFVSSDFDRTLSVWRRLPDESGAPPDLIYHLPRGGWDNEIYQGRFLSAGGDTVHVWDQLPTEPVAPSVTLRSPIGGVAFQQIGGVAQDGSYFYLADRATDRVYAWRGIPDQETPPAFSFSVADPGRLSSNGRYLAVPSVTSIQAGGGLLIYEVASLGPDAQPLARLGGGSGPLRFNLPEGALLAGEALFVADTPFSRVLVWRTVEDALAGHPPEVVLGEGDLQDTTPEIGRNKLFWPGAVAFDGSYLWVGEFKFADRILRFSVQP